jgi:hypothetical protein
MDTAATPEQRRPPGPRRLAATLVAISLALGLAAGAYSWLSSSLQVPGPAEVAGTAELRARGAEAFVEFCGWPKFEPRFWPECRGGADEWRARGAQRLVEFCVDGVPSRMFTAPDCVDEDRAAFVLAAGPSARDVATGGTVAAVALAVLAILVLARAAVAGGRRAGPLSGVG